MIFEVDEYLEIEILEGYYRGEYMSRVVTSNVKELLVTAPRNGDSFIPLRKGQLVKISVPKRDARYNFEAQVVSLPEQEFGYLTLNIASDVERQQRRSDVRMAVKIPVELLYFYRQGAPVAAFSVNCLDLSAGGVRLEVPEEFPPQTRFFLAIILPDEEIQVNAVVIRTGLLPRPDSGTSLSPYWASMKFFNITESKKKKILKFIYKQQELKVKGLI